MVSYIWRSTDGQENNTTKRGTRSAAGTDVITFSKTSVTDGKYLHQTQLDMIVGIGENEKPKGNVNELQDTFLDSITWTITGSVVTNAGDGEFYNIKPGYWNSHNTGVQLTVPLPSNDESLTEGTIQILGKKTGGDWERLGVWNPNDADFDVS